MNGAGVDVFVSYSRSDIEAVRELVAGLDARGIRAIFDEQIPAGVRWQAELRSALARAQTTLVVVGAGSLGPWQDVEVETAIDLAVHDVTRRIVPVLLPGASLERQQQLFLARYEWIDLRAGMSAPAIDRLAADLRLDAIPRDDAKSRVDAPPAPQRGGKPARTPAMSISASHGSVAAGSIANSVVIVGATAPKTNNDD